MGNGAGRMQRRLKNFVECCAELTTFKCFGCEILGLRFAEVECVNPGAVCFDSWKLSSSY
ncbi:hypothetical protein Ancab_019044 [Ancistrocladus abbreviatus]